MPTSNNPSGVVGVSVVEEHGVEYGPEGAMPWTSVYVKLLVAFRRQALRKLKGAPAWRQYCYFPTVQAVYSKECLDDIADFISRL